MKRTRILGLLVGSIAILAVACGSSVSTPVVEPTPTVALGRSTRSPQPGGTKDPSIATPTLASADAPSARPTPGSRAPTVTSPAAPGTTESPSIATPTPALAVGAPCPVTVSGRVPLPPEVAEAVRKDWIFGAGRHGEGMYGSGALWVSALPDDGVLVLFPQDGELRAKIPWWRSRLGTLHIEGRRLDAPAPPLRVRQQDVYAAGFLPNTLVFPSEGCWEVVARLDNEDLHEELRFVLRVVRGATDPGAALDRFMRARLARDDQLALALLTDQLRAEVRSVAVQAPFVQPSSPCWYRYEILSVALSTPTNGGGAGTVAKSTAVARTRVYEHWWTGDVGGSPPRSWEQEIRLVKVPYPGWLVDGLSEAQGRRLEPNEPHGSSRSACKMAAASLSPAPLTSAAAAACPVTLPNGKAPPGPSNTDFNLGNEAGTIFTIPWPGGKVIFSPRGPGQQHPNGSLEMKWPWYKTIFGEGVITGRRLDGPAPPLPTITLGHPPAFYPTGLRFPSAGCWEVTASVGEDRLTFVTLVVKLPFDPPRPRWLPDGLTFDDWDVTGLPTAIGAIYATPTGGEVSIETSHGMPENRDTAPDVAGQPVMVDGRSAACTQGAWDAQHQWRTETDAGSIAWSVGEFSYRISQTGLELTCADLQHIAESLCSIPDEPCIAPGDDRDGGRVQRPAD